MSKNLSIAYAMKRKAKKMAEGGGVKGFFEKGVHQPYFDEPDTKQEMGESRAGDHAKRMDIGRSKSNWENKPHKEKAIEEHHQVLGEMKAMPNPKLKGLAYGGEMKACKNCGHYDDGGPVLPGAQSAQDSMRKAFKFAEGGQITDNYQPSGKPHVDKKVGHESAEFASGFMDHEGNTQRPNGMAMSEAAKKLNQLMPDMHAETSMSEQDLVDRIMQKKSKDFSSEARFSQGGKVANQDEIEAGFMPNEFDDLHLRDDLESTYGDDDNAGDMLGNHQEDMDREDIISRIMRSQKKKDRMPNPA